MSVQPNGSGSHPTSFTADNQTFYVRSTTALLADASDRIGANLWTVSGANSKIVVGESETRPSLLLVPNDSDIDALIDVNKGSYLLNRHPMGSTPGNRNFRLGSLASTSTVNYFSASSMHSIAAAQYDNLTLSGTNPDRSINQKVLAGNVIVARTLSIGDGSNLVLGNKNLTLLRSGGVFLVSSETAYVVANGTGSLRVQVPRASSSSKAGDIVTFPVGSSFTSYTPITLQQTSTASDNVFEVRMLDNVYKTYNATTYAPGPTVITAEAVNKT